MPRLLCENAKVDLNGRNLPSRFVWREREYRVAQVQECWRLTGAWWDGEGEYTFFRVLAQEGGVYELCYSHKGDAWTLSVVED